MFNSRLENKIINKQEKIKKLNIRLLELQEINKKHKDSLMKSKKDIDLDSIVRTTDNIAYSELQIRELQNIIKSLNEEPVFEMSEVIEAWKDRSKEILKVLNKNNEKVEAAYKVYMQSLKDSFKLSSEIIKEENEWDRITHEFGIANENKQCKWKPNGVDSDDIFRNNQGKYSKYLTINTPQVVKYEGR